MVVSFAVKHFCGAFLHGKKVPWVIRKNEDLFFGWPSRCVRATWPQQERVEKRMCVWNLWGSVLKRLIRITKGSGDVKPTKLVVCRHIS